MKLPLIKSLDLRLPPPSPFEPDPWAVDWEWPPVPKCAGSRHYVTFPPIVVSNGDVLPIRMVYGPFGMTVLAP